MSDAPPLPVIGEADFEAQVLGSSLPVLVVFTASWCTWCTKLDPIVRMLQKVTPETLRVVKVDTEASPGVAARYNIKGLPTMLLLRKGKILWTRKGMISLQQLVPALNEALAPT